MSLEKQFCKCKGISLTRRISEGKSITKNVGWLKVTVFKVLGFTGWRNGRFNFTIQFTHLLYFHEQRQQNRSSRLLKKEEGSYKKVS